MPYSWRDPVRRAVDREVVAALRSVGDDAGEIAVVQPSKPLRNLVTTALAPVVAVFMLFSSCFSGPRKAGTGQDPVAQSAPAAEPLVNPFDPSSQITSDPWPGFGTSTTGGLDGTVLRVTTLDANGPGSLRRALDDPRPRLVVFEVGGVIDLQGHSLEVLNPHLTVAGQTAPDPGITLIRGELSVETHDVVIQHLTVRPGNRGPAGSHGASAPDGMGARRSKAGPVYNVVFDHCSASWAIDENLSVSGPRDVDSVRDVDITSHDVTLRRCLIAEGLSHATHPKGEHSKGTLIHDGVRNVAILGCVYAHNRDRNPRLKGGTTSIVAGNVMYNWGGACVGVGIHGNRSNLRPAETLLAGNVAIAGPDTRSRVFVKSVDPGGRAFLRNNVVLDASGRPLPMADDGVVKLTAPPDWSLRIPDMRPLEAAAQALRSAGSRPAHRDPIDARIVQSIIHGDGRIIDSQEQVGGYPVRATTTRSVVVPDGIEARRRWLDTLSDELSEDKGLDLAPLWLRLGIRQVPAAR